MKNVILRALLALSVTGAATAPAMAVVDDGSGCGCIRPCQIIIR